MSSKITKFALHIEKMFNFINISVIDIIDILLVALLIFQLFKIIRGTAALNIGIGIIVLYVTWIVVKALDMNLLSSILGQILGVGIIALIVLFQQEIRKFLLHLGSKSISRSDPGKLTKVLFGKGKEIPIESVDELAEACNRMSETRTGALIVLSHVSSLEYVINTGDRIDSIINRRLIENIFYKNTPLHDGALIIEDNRMIAARCTLPINDNPNIPPQYGMRHRAACSISSETDADAIVVSEETGNISFVSNGEIKTMTSISELKLNIENSYKRG
jgi:diadenylate cyclase